MKLGIRLTVYLVSAVSCTMIVFGYFSIRQDRQNLLRELRLGMVGFSEAVQESLTDIYADEGDLDATQTLIDRLGPSENIHSVIVYDRSANPVVQSPSVEDIRIYSDVDIWRVLSTGEAVEGLVNHEGRLIYYRAEPILNSRFRTAGAFLLSRQGTELAEAIETRRDWIVLTTANLVLLICLLIFAIVQRNISRPINKLILGIRELGEGRWGRLLDISGHDEVSVLGKEFNNLSSRLEDAHKKLLREQEEKLNLERDLRHSEKLASVGQLAAGIAHEIGTPLNIIGGRAEHMLRRQRTPEEMNENLQIIRCQIDRIAGIVRQLLEFSRRREPNLREVDMGSLLKNIKNLFQHRLDEKKIHAVVDLADDLPVLRADGDLLQQVFINLFQNSLQAMETGGTIKIHATANPYSGPDHDGTTGRHQLVVIFEDNGPGISSDHIGRVFEPFFTTKDVGNGTGLGLALAYRIVKEHHGDIRVESEPGKFTRFIVALPLNRGDRGD